VIVGKVLRHDECRSHEVLLVKIEVKRYLVRSLSAL
jgi:hypothetical protein